MVFAGLEGIYRQVFIIRGFIIRGLLHTLIGENPSRGRDQGERGPIGGNPDPRAGSHARAQRSAGAMLEA